MIALIFFKYKKGVGRCALEAHVAQRNDCEDFNNIETWGQIEGIGCNDHFLKSAQVFSASCLFPPMPPLPRRGSKFRKNRKNFRGKMGFS